MVDVRFLKDKNMRTSCKNLRNTLCSQCNGASSLELSESKKEMLFRDSILAW